MELDVRHLKLMAALVQAGSMTKASEDLHLTQSALSHQLKDAEDKIGTPLFVRKNKKLVMTPAGKQFWMVARETLDRLHVGLKSIRETANEETRSLRIRTDCYTSFSWIPSALKSYSELFPRVKIELGTAMDNAIGDLKKGKTDVAIMHDEVKDKSIFALPLFNDELKLIMAPSHLLAQKRSLTPKDLDGETIVIYNIPDEESTLITTLMKPAGAKPGRVIRVDLTEGIIGLVKAGVGVGLLADWAVVQQVTQGTIVTRSTGSKDVCRTWHVAVNQRDAEQFHIREFMDILKRELRPPG